jgi:hypothetical protein
MPPVDLASGDKHAPVKSAAARRPAVAPPVSDWVRPSFWLVRGTTETLTPPARGRHAHDAEQCDELASPHWFASADERTLLHR